MKARKKIIAVLAILVLFLVAVWHFIDGESLEPQAYIFDRTSDVTLSDVEIYKKRLAFSTKKPEGGETAFDIREYFLDNDVSTHTLKYFKHLEMVFKKSKNLDDHFTSVYKYLLAQLPKEDAEKLFEMYKKYLTCEMGLAGIQKEWGMPTTLEQMLELLAKSQAYRREQLGDELADSLFEAGVKSKEYAIRRSSIADDSTLYGKEKEALVQELNEDMWGDEADLVNDYPKPYVRYREKMSMYKKDLAELGAGEEKDRLIKDFREEMFSPEVVAKLESVDKQLLEEKNNEAGYRAAEKTLMNNTSLTDADKDKQIDVLQKQYFKDPEAFKRSENMRLGKERLQRERS